MKMVLVQCSQVSRSYNLQQRLLGGDAGLCHVSCAPKPAQQCGSGCSSGHGDVQLEGRRDRLGHAQGSGAWTEVGTGTKACGCWGEAGSWPGLCGLWLSGPRCWAQGWDPDRTLQEGVSWLLVVQHGQSHCLFARMLVGLWCPCSPPRSPICARM